ncbi:TetR/AcrR family transcriptional regulator [Bradyrhizobium sp. LHD-71]|uniref:TetR/AcrR family transcriptional regulator n=1 Tax=Bradyrhizobium sp. LHD-71 TaxID=3072141 RepID=UPI00280EA708|nr:TetR/AcrR family transcriptional regulator [Bradyrhizobium sp. LHD-71]MDQ8729637.1 TetR/AcrR family transcriptional regulator [Bradyrhizobium sp. LHD-71]
MATQADRRAATQAAILKAARALFGNGGFQATTMDDIAAAARVAKGAVYHHFKTKEAVFEAVFEEASRDLVAEIDSLLRAEKDVLTRIAIGTQHYLAACAKGPTGQIILRDGPAVLGWERWRAIDAQHFGGKIPRALEAAMERGLIARQPVQPLARLLLGAMTEAAVACAGAADISEAGAGYSRAFSSLLEAMRVK